MTPPSPHSPGQMSRMQGGTPHPLSRGARVPHQRHSAAVLRAPHRDHRRAPGPHKWTSYEALLSVLREVLCHNVWTL